MQQTAIVVGFSELKNLLIEKYGIDVSREKIKLYFTEEENQLVLHDYNNHERAIILVANIQSKKLSDILKGHASELCLQSIKYKNPAKFLNEQFQLHGFFRS